MKFSINTLVIAIAIFLLCSPAIAAQTYPGGDVVRGVVFNDANCNQARDDGEEGIAGVCVSNGREVVMTGVNGDYELPISDDAIIFVIKPQNWKTPTDENNLPRFYYIHKPDGSPGLKYPGVEPTGPLPDSVDFPLYFDEEPEQFRAVVFGDPQPKNQYGVDYTAHDVVEELIGIDAEFGVTLGDIVQDDLTLFEGVNSTIAKVGIPWYNVHGNHDINMDTSDDKYSDETFERIYGPSYYAFDYGEVHFIVLDNIVWGEGGYSGGFGERQLDFVRNDLAFVPDDKLIVLMMHIPLAVIQERGNLLEIISDRPYTLSLSAHWHLQCNFFFGGLSGWDGTGRHHHLVCGTVCGSWWNGAPDEVGIPHSTMHDGTPNGYSFITFDGNEYSIEYKVARRPASYQMNIFAPEEVTSEDAADVKVIVNVFAGSAKSIVEMKFGENGEWTRMKKSMEKDPYIELIKKAEASDHPPRGHFLPSPKPSDHIWVGNLPSGPEPGTHVIYVRTTDMYGQEYEGRRIIRIN